MSNIEQQIEATNKQLEKLKAKKKALQAKERNARRIQKRKDDTRKKILVGAELQKFFAAGNELAIRLDRGAYRIHSIDQLLEMLCSSEREREFLKIEGKSPAHLHWLNKQQRDQS